MRSYAIIIGTVLIAAAFAGCASNSNDGYASAYVKDAPTATWKSVTLNFTEISVHQSSGNETQGWRTLFSDTHGASVDLLNASGTKAAFLGEAGLPAGHYQQIRIAATSAWGIDLAGVAHTIQVPDKQPLRITKSFKVDGGKETQLIIDIDLEKALELKNGSWEFKQKIGKVYAHVKDHSTKPTKGEVGNVDLTDDA